MGLYAAAHWIVKEAVSAEHIQHVCESVGFGPQEVPVEELTRLTHLLRHEGVTIDQLLSMVEAGEPPTLSKPETQVALMHLVGAGTTEKAVIKQVLVQQAKEEKAPIGLQALMAMVCFLP